MHAEQLWGRELVLELVPQRPPLLMVDRVLRWNGDGRASLTASKQIDLSEPALAGHFPGQPVWPGVLTVEGLAQTCRMLGTLERLAAERSRAEVMARLDNLERWLRGISGVDEPSARETRSQLSSMNGPGLLVAIDLRWTRPVFPGGRLDYHATLQRRMDSLVRFDVEACVLGETVARGALTTARQEA